MTKLELRMNQELRMLEELYDFYLERIENVDYIDQENMYREKLHDLRVQIDLLNSLMREV